MIIDKNISLFFLKIARCSRSELVFTFRLSTSPCSYIKGKGYRNSVIFLFGMVLPFLRRARVTCPFLYTGRVIVRSPVFQVYTKFYKDTKNGLMAN